MRNGQIRTSETALYVDVWQTLDQYGAMSPGEQWAKAFDHMVDHHMGSVVLDAGCGSGKGAIALAKLGYRVACCDLTDAGLVEDAQAFPFVSSCLWDDLRRQMGGQVDYVFCCDVMEHVPKEFTMLTISRLLEVAKRGVFLSITFVPDNFGVLIGRALHQTVEPFTWWKARLSELGDVRDARDLLQSGLFLVERAE